MTPEQQASTMQQKHDIHNAERKYTTAVKALASNKFSKINLQYLTDFLKDAGNGYHLPNRTSKPVGKHKLSAYTYYLIRWTQQYGKDWHKITTEELKNLTQTLRENKIAHKRTGQPVRESTKMTMSVILKMFLRWLNEKKTLTIKHDLIDCREPPRKMPDYLTKEQVDHIVLKTNSPLYRALVMTLFDAGLRIEEALNVKIKDVHYIDTPAHNKLMRIDVRISKTEARNPELFLAQEPVQNWLSVHPTKEDPESYVFAKTTDPLSYQTVRKYLARIGQELKPKTRLYPHLFRHSSATYYASRLNRHQICLRYGWQFSSKMPDVYIRRSGVDNNAVVKQFEADNLTELKKQNQTLQEQIKILSARMTQVSTQQTLSDKIMNQLMKIPNVQKILVKNVIESGLAKQLVEKES